MASVTCTRSDLFPNGTVLKAFPRRFYHTGSAIDVPVGTPTAEGTMTSGTVTLEGLTAGQEYVLFAEVSSKPVTLLVQAPESAAVEAAESGLTAAQLNLLAWAFDPQFASGTFGGASFTAGTLYKTRIPVKKEVKVSKLLLFLTTKGATLTASQCFLALFAEGTRTLIAKATAAEAIAAAEGTNNTIAEVPLEAAVTLGPGYVDLGQFWNGTTKPTWGAAPQTAQAALVNAGQAGAANLRAASADTGRTTSLPATMSSTQTAVAASVWAALV